MEYIISSSSRQRGGEEFGGKSIDKLLRLQKEILDPSGIQLLRIRKRQWQDNGFVERTHRTDDEEFYVPHPSKIKDLDQHFRFALKWVYRFNCQRAHFGKHMDSKTPYQRLREKLPHIDEKFCLFPPLILDAISCGKPLRGGHDLSAYYFSYGAMGFRDHGAIEFLPKAIEYHQVNWLLGVPKLYTKLLELKGDIGEKLSSLRYAVSSAAPLSVKALKEFEEKGRVPK